MQVRYQVSGASHAFDAIESEDLPGLCREVESHLRSSHPELTDKPYLAERITDAMLNALAGDAGEVELGEVG